MGEGDHIPTGGHARSYDPHYAAKIKAGGKRADAIRSVSDKHHQSYEVPTAEQELEKALATLINSKKNK